MQRSQVYILIQNFSGETHVQVVDPEILLAGIENGQYGDHPKFFTHPPADSDTNSWDGYFLLLKAEVVTPVPKEVVTKYVLE